MDLHDRIVRELLEHKSFAALIWLIERGRELEFSVDGVPCFISRSGSEKVVSLWVDGKQQAFDSIEQLIENAVIGQNRLLDICNTIQISTLF